MGYGGGKSITARVRYGGENYVSEVEIKLPLKRFPDSSVSSLILVGWCEEGHPATKNSLQYPRADNEPMEIYPL